MVAEFLYFLVVLILFCLEPFGLLILTLFFVSKFLFFRLIFLDSFFDFFSSKLKNKSYVLASVFLNLLLLVTSFLPLLLLICDFRRYVLLYIFCLNVTIYDLYYNIYLEDIFYLFFFGIFCYGFYKNKAFISQEYKEFLIILNRYIFPYLKKKFYSFWIFFNNDFFPHLIYKFNIFKSFFLVQLKRSEWYHLSTNFLNYYLRKYKSRFKK